LKFKTARHTKYTRPASPARPSLAADALADGIATGIASGMASGYSGIASSLPSGIETPDVSVQLRKGHETEQVGVCVCASVCASVYVCHAVCARVFCVSGCTQVAKSNRYLRVCVRGHSWAVGR